jgi:hypothetical protein
MSFEPHHDLRHILAESDDLLQERAHLTLEQFVASGTLQRAFVRSLEIIGEASKKSQTPIAHSIRASSGGNAGPAHPQLFRRGIRIGMGWSHHASNGFQRTTLAAYPCGEFAMAASDRPPGAGPPSRSCGKRRSAVGQPTALPDWPRQPSATTRTVSSGQRTRLRDDGAVIRTLPIPGLTEHRVRFEFPLSAERCICIENSLKIRIKYETITN